ncbi:MAG: citrate synthase/methylcitrate synthase [Deltaproteobacteria bacterium]|nr:citrate synthase/methylcitrate synthase [Deltaproteobacteria bacterium]
MATGADPTQQLIRGLEDVIVCTSQVSDVDGERGVLTYRGYDINDLAAHATFEETSWLLLEGELPTKAQLEQFKKSLTAARMIPTTVLQVLKALPREAQPMALLRTAVSALGCADKNEAACTVENLKTIGTRLIAQIATLGAAIWRIKNGQDPVMPDPSLDHGANFLYMLQGTKPSPEAARTMDVALVLHADHEIPASTFSAMCILSSLADIYSAITGAIGSLKGPLHGGANEDVLKNLAKIGGPEKVTAYLDDVQVKKGKVPGIGHRVYKAYDPRATILKRYAETASRQSSLAALYATAVELEKQCVARFGPKGLYPNVDFFSGLVYCGLGIDPQIFTPIFAIARMAGWVARLVEYLPENRIFRPRALYQGPTPRKLTTGHL